MARETAEPRYAGAWRILRSRGLRPGHEPAIVLGSGSPGPTVPDTEPERTTSGIAPVFEETGIDAPIDELVALVREAASCTARFSTDSRRALS